MTVKYSFVYKTSSINYIHAVVLSFFCLILCCYYPIIEFRSKELFQLKDVEKVFKQKLAFKRISSFCVSVCFLDSNFNWNLIFTSNAIIIKHFERIRKLWEISFIDCATGSFECFVFVFNDVWGLASIMFWFYLTFRRKVTGQEVPMFNELLLHPRTNDHVQLQLSIVIINLMRFTHNSCSQ